MRLCPTLHLTKGNLARQLLYPIHGTQNLLLNTPLSIYHPPPMSLSHDFPIQTTQALPHFLDLPTKPKNLPANSTNPVTTTIPIYPLPFPSRFSSSFPFPLFSISLSPSLNHNKTYTHTHKP